MAEEKNNQQAQQVQPQAGPEQGSQFTFDYDKLASIVAGKQAVTEDSVLKGYFKTQGLTGDEMQKAIDMYKADKAAKTPDIGALNQQVAQANSRAVQAEMKVEAMTMASELGVDQKTVPYLLKMADLSSAVVDGQIDRDKLKEALNNVLKDVPQLKSQASEQVGGFKIGGDGGSKQNETNTDELARIFGVKKRG
jgi:hypothetical protein